MTKARLLIFAAISVLPGFLKKPIYRLAFGARIEGGVRIGFGALLAFRELVLERGARIGAFNVIRVDSLRMRRRARIGSFVNFDCHTMDLGSASTVSSSVNIRADHRDPRSAFRMGSESWVLEFCYINPARPITLGRNVGVGGGSYLFGHGLWLSKLEGYPVAHGPITIGDDVWLPWGCFILPGVEIGSGAVIGARSLVTKSLPPRVLAAGTPAKVVREEVAKAPSLAQRNDMLLEATTDFAAFTKAAVTFDETADWTHCRIDGEPLFHLAKRAGTFAPPPDDGASLCLVHDAFTAWSASHPRVYSLVSYQSCEFDRIGGRQRRWLAHLRELGVRYYPVDEVRVEA